MDEYSSEKEQVEELKKYWKQNGAFILTGLIIGVAVLGGWRYWKQYRLERAAAASAHYEELVVAVAGNDSSGATALFERLSADFGATPYAAQAGLAMARLAVDRGELDEAARLLRGVIAGTQDDYLAMVARLRLARVLVAQNLADEALDVLAVADPGTFAARFHNVRGDALAVLGRTAAARSEYQAALDKFEPGLFDRRLVEMKINDLAGAADDSAPDPGA